jgi:hypothetical protein
MSTRAPIPAPPPAPPPSPSNAIHPRTPLPVRSTIFARLDAFIRYRKWNTPSIVPVAPSTARRC